MGTPRRCDDARRRSNVAIKHSYALRRWTHGVSMALALCRGRIAQLLDRVTPTDAGDGDDTAG